MSSIGKRISFYRKKANPPISQRVLSELALGKSGTAGQAIISRIEAGKQQPRPAQLKKIADVINAPYDELISLLSQDVTGEILPLPKPINKLSLISKPDPWDIVKNLQKLIERLEKDIERLEAENQQLKK